jgi:hypothetical protein
LTGYSCNHCFSYWFDLYRGKSGKVATKMSQADPGF